MDEIHAVDAVRPLLPEEEEISGPDDGDDGPPDGLPGDLWF